MKKNDLVIIPFGSKAEAYGKVTSIRKVPGKNAPFPPDRTKRIIRKADCIREYEFLCVLPITHKQKIFSYINTLHNVKVGDYVEIDFRGEPRPARVNCIISGTLANAPENFMGSMEVLRKLSYDNSDFIRFQSELRPLGQNHELFVYGEKGNHKSKKRGLTEKAMAEFETVYKVRLPEEYRNLVCSGIDEYDELYGPDVQEYRQEYTRMKKPFGCDELIRRAIENENWKLTPTYDCEFNCDEC